MEGDLQPLYLLLTDCYIYLLRKGNQQKKTCALVFFSKSNTFALCSFAGAADKPYTVEDAVSYNELDYLSVSFTTLA